MVDIAKVMCAVCGVSRDTNDRTVNKNSVVCPKCRCHHNIHFGPLACPNPRMCSGSSWCKLHLCCYIDKNGDHCDRNFGVDKYGDHCRYHEKGKVECYCEPCNLAFKSVDKS